MNRFVKRVIVFLAIQCVIGTILVTNAVYKPRLGYLAAFDDKLKLLCDHDEPHLILIGGSNIAFGIDSEKLENEIGLPVINAGMHGSAGLQFCLDIAEYYARPGDIILLIPEWPLLSSRLYPQKQYMQDLLRQSPSAWKFWVSNPAFDWKCFIDEQALPEIAHIVQSGLIFQTPAIQREQRYKAQQPGVYSRLNFNEYGDFIGHHELNTKDKIKNIDTRYYFNADYYAITTARINSCATACFKKGATMYFAYCPVPESVFDNSGSDLTNAHQYLVEHLDIPVIHPPARAKYPASYFFDTICHLNLTGKKVRTELVSTSLSEQLAIIAENPTAGIMR